MSAKHSQVRGRGAATVDYGRVGKCVMAAGTPLSDDDVGVRVLLSQDKYNFEAHHFGDNEVFNECFLFLFLLRVDIYVVVDVFASSINGICFSKAVSYLFLGYVDV